MVHIAISEGASHRHMVEIFKAGETAEPFTAIGDLLLGIECIKGIAVALREADPVVLDDKPVDVLETVDDIRLSASQDFDLDQAILDAFLVDGLNGVDH